MTSRTCGCSAILLEPVSDLGQPCRAGGQAGGRSRRGRHRGGLRHLWRADRRSPLRHRSRHRQPAAQSRSDPAAAAGRHHRPPHRGALSSGGAARPAPACMPAWSLLFSLLAVTPAIIVAVFSASSSSSASRTGSASGCGTRSTTRWPWPRPTCRSTRRMIRADALAMAADLNREAARLLTEPGRFGRWSRPGGAALLDRGHRVRRLRQDAGPHRAVLHDGGRADPGKRAGARPARRSRLMVTDTDDRVRALVRLDGFGDAYLFVGRFVDAVLGHMEARRRRRAMPSLRASAPASRSPSR